MKQTKTSDLPGIKGAGVAPVQIEEVDKAAAIYVRERDKRCAMTPKEVDAKMKLIDLLHVHEKKIGRGSDGVLRYQYDGEEGDLVIELRPGKEKLKVVSSNDGEEEEEE